MRTLALITIVFFIVACGGAPPDPEPELAVMPSPAAEPGAGMIERLDPAMAQLVPADAVIERLADGFGFVEGPVWVADGDGYLLFSDIPANKIVKWAPDGEVSDFLVPVYEGE